MFENSSGFFLNPLITSEFFLTTSSYIGLSQIIEKLGYKCNGIKTKKEKKGTMYRTHISTTSAQKFYGDILNLKKDFPTCGLAQKEPLLQAIVKRQTRMWGKKGKGITKANIMKLISQTSLNSKGLYMQLNIAPSSLREHLAQLEKEDRIVRTKQPHTCCLLWSKV